jgi:uncharacterized protein (DUF2384 family)
LATGTFTAAEVFVEPFATADSVRAHALETFGSDEKVEHWLARPNHVFGGVTPMSLIDNKPGLLEIELTRIDHGVYI